MGGADTAEADTGGTGTGGAGTGGADTAEVVGALIATAIQALAHENSRAYDAAAGRLEVRRHGDDWQPVVERTLAMALSTAIGATWRRGWQPADLMRVIGRRLSVRHVRLLRDAMAAEMSAYATATVDPRWVAQLAELEVGVWWPKHRTYLGEWRDQLDADAAYAVPCALEVLFAVQSLPPLELLGPPPGEYRPDSPSTRRDGPAVDDRVLSRVRALLAKAESTTFPAEAETFTAGAQALMARHSIDAALLAATAPSTRTPGASARRIGIDSPYEGPKAVLLDAVARANHCRSVWTRGLGFSTIVGYEADLDGVEALFTSLLVQATTAMNRAGAVNREAPGARGRSRSFRQSFLTAYATRIGERLIQATREQTQAAVAELTGTDLVPVLARRSQAVDEALTTLFPKVRHKSVGGVSDHAGWVSGLSAADHASLHSGRRPLT